MFPILLISKNNKTTEKYLNDFIKSNKFISHHIFRYQPDPNIIKIDHIREIKSMLIRTETDKKLIIIYGFNTAKIEAQNAFLKTLEEKTASVQFIIIVESETQALSTIISRCKIVKLKHVRRSDTSLKKDQSFSFIQPLPQLLFQYNNMNKDKAIKLCDGFLWYFKSLLYKDSPLPRTVLVKIAKEIIKVRNLILKNNLNPQIAIDHLLIFIKK